ncbi:MAG: DUF5658 family protein [Fimbriimonas sp.]
MTVAREQLSVKKALWRPVLPETTLLAMICMVDMALTIVLIGMGVAREANPVLSSLVQVGIWAFAIVKTASFVVPLAIIEAIRPLSPKFIERAVQLGLIGYLITYGCGVAHLNRAFIPFLS